MQKLIASQKPTELKLNNSLKNVEKNDKKIFNPNLPSNRKPNINIKEQKIIFFNKHNNDKEKANIVNNANNENLNPNRQFFSKSNSLSNNNNNFNSKVLQSNKNFQDKNKNSLNDFAYNNQSDFAETEPSYSNCFKSDFFNSYDNANQLVNENACYKKQNDYYFSKSRNAKKEFIPRFQHYKKCKKAINTSSEWDRLWGITMQPPRNKFSEQEQE